MKRKIAFVHFGKCAGVKTNKLFKRACAKKNIPVYTWDTPIPNIERDWSNIELKLLSDLEKGYVHNHHVSWSKENIQLYNKKGWETFTFLRNPKDLICSLYFWSRKVLEEKGESPLKGNPTESSGTLDEFVRSIVSEESKNMRRLFIPQPYIWSEVKHVATFSEDKLWDLLKTFGLYDEDLDDLWRGAKANVSGNKGWDHYVDVGLISGKSVDAVEKLLK